MNREELAEEIRGAGNLLRYADGLPVLWRFWHRPFSAELFRKGFEVVGDFHCRGFGTWGPLRRIGGMNHRHPDHQDLERAAEFARNMMAKSGSQRVFKAAG